MDGGSRPVPGARGGTAYAADTVFSTDIVDGEVKNADIGNNQVTSAKIYPGSVTQSDIHEGAVDSAKVLYESLAAVDLGPNSVGSDEIATDAVGDRGHRWCDRQRRDLRQHADRHRSGSQLDHSQ